MKRPNNAPARRIDMLYGSIYQLRALFFLAIGLALVACGTQHVYKLPVTADGQLKRPLGPIQFYDSGSFDTKLSEALRQNPPEQQVIPAADITVNKIPERMDKWLAAIEKSGGRVELKPQGNQDTRGLIGAVIDLILGVYELAREKMIYGPADNYNAEIHYQRGSGTIIEVVFVRRAAPTANQPKS